MKFRIKPKLNPIYKKEVKQSVRSIKLPVLLVLFNSVLAFIGLAGFYVTNEQVKMTGNIDYRANIYLYILMITIEFILLVFIIPAMTSGLISGERERQTLDILITSRLKPRQIITGKLFSALGNIALILFSGLPAVSIAFIYGGIDLRDIIKTVMYLLFAALFLGSIGIFCSSALKKTTFATVLTYGIEMVIFFGPLIIVMLARYIRFAQTSQQDGRIGLLALILLINPGITFFDIMFGQVGSISYLDNAFEKLGLNSFAADHFIVLSILVQLAVLILFTYLAVRHLTYGRFRTKNK